MFVANNHSKFLVFSLNDWHVFHVGQLIKQRRQTHYLQFLWINWAFVRHVVCKLQMEILKTNGNVSYSRSLLNAPHPWFLLTFLDLETVKKVLSYVIMFMFLVSVKL